MPPPPYGGYGVYGRPAAPKPGLIPLRPLTVGEILDGAFSAIRWNPKTILASSAVVAAISGVLGGVVTYLVQSQVLANVNVPAGGTLTPAQAGKVAAATAITLGITLVIALFAHTILTGLLTVAIGQGVLGRKETVGSAWRATRSRLGRLFATVLLATVFILLGWALAVGLSILVGALIGEATNSVAVAIIISLLLGGTATVFAVITWLRWSLAIPVVMLEPARPVASLRRSWRLVRRSTWRVLGILLLTELIVAIAGFIIKVPFGLASGTSSFTSHVHESVVAVTVSAIGGIVASTVTAPMLAGVVVLLYTDLRMRREGMDITLQAAAAGEVPAGQGASGQNPGPW